MRWSGHPWPASRASIPSGRWNVISRIGTRAARPGLLLVAVAVQTRRIRVGLGPVICAPELNHPSRVGGRPVLLGILSGGLLELKTARSCSGTLISATASLRPSGTGTNRVEGSARCGPESIGRGTGMSRDARALDPEEAGSGCPYAALAPRRCTAERNSTPPRGTSAVSRVHRRDTVSRSRQGASITAYPEL